MATHSPKDVAAAIKAYDVRGVVGEGAGFLNEQFVRDSLLRDIAWEVEARGLAASILMNAKDWLRAEEQLTEILKLAPERSNEYYNRGLARYYQGNLSAASSACW